MKNKKKINEMTAGSVLMGPNTDCTGHGGDVPGGSSHTV